MNIKKIITLVLVIGLFVASFGFFYIYNKAFTPNTSFSEKQIAINIPSKSSFLEVTQKIAPFIKDSSNFVFVAKQRKYHQNVKAGHFILKKGMTNFDIIQALRKNIPIKIHFNNQETVGSLAQRLSQQIEPDSLAFVKAFTNASFLSENEVTEATVLTLFIPNSYEFYWNTSARKIAQRLAKEHIKFWHTNNRLEKAKKLKLTPTQVSILASIVQKETAKVEERPIVAGVYLNRLKKGMPLQADPTVIYALKKEKNNFNLVIKRVLKKDLSVASPYNTYKHNGLPPGPIAMPDISSIDAVLNAQKNNYLYFCANPEKPGYHSFAVNYTQHLFNAKKYSKWINSLNIKR